ncbi:MAG: high-potential iron-sulfur protein [Gammaproteobacteria bacterium]
MKAAAGALALLALSNSRCAGCYFFDGRGSAESAPCSVFAGWRVPSGGWCREFAPKGR